MSELKNDDVKKLYDSDISKRYEDDYEFNRWFTSERLRCDYFMNYVAIKRLAQSINFSSCLELGPGPGTWTRVLYKINPEADFTLVDISEAMRNQFRLEMREVNNVDYNVSDFMNFSSSKQFDLFFSSRAIEYLENKSDFFNKLFEILQSGGKGLVVTKNKDFGLFKFRQDKRFQHQGQMSVAECKKFLQNAGFKNVEFYPAIIRLPLFDRINSRFAEHVFKKFASKQIPEGIVNKLTESYIVKFEK